MVMCEMLSSEFGNYLMRFLQFIGNINHSYTKETLKESCKNKSDLEE